jgi:predicted Zn-dependent protease
MDSLEQPDLIHLNAAQGWLELGNWREANEELEEITAARRAHPTVLEVCAEIYAKAGKWFLASSLARRLIQVFPKEARFWISHAYATRRMDGGGIPSAQNILITAHGLFPKNYLIAYNLACYVCQLGDKKEAWRWPLIWGTRRS